MGSPARFSGASGGSRAVSEARRDSSNLLRLDSLSACSQARFVSAVLITDHVASSSFLGYFLATSRSMFVREWMCTRASEESFSCAGFVKSVLPS